ncbi:uncharacterized protein LOC129598128 [Paramacrobiotus metropolitanus]|uniref:uncharacterized protein LOC129598128 n=1 Tax=Paramacrobiotus metropolitanus TaxID=2943436 RepID=UPI002445B817|nr:uncharacterized protein LOC129598128 [Paramacrobiotus metropolitanus]
MICAEQDEKKRQVEPLDFEAQVALAIADIRASEMLMYYVRVGLVLFPDTPVCREAAERIRAECGLPSLFNPPESPRTRRRRELEEENKRIEHDLCCVECENYGPGTCGRMFRTPYEPPVPKLWGSRDQEDSKNPASDLDDWWEQNKLDFPDPLKVWPENALWVDEKLGIEQTPKQKRKLIVVQRHSLRGIPYNYWK